MPVPDAPVLDRRAFAQKVLELGSRNDFDGLLGLMAPDARMEWPYVPSGDWIRLNGRAQIEDFLRKADQSPVRWDEFRDVVIYETADPEAVIVEYEADGHLSTTGEPFHQSVIVVLRIRDGRIVLYRDYINPIKLIKAGVVPPETSR
ncbi:MAG TPA: nuclear transport factor 2 family protein [Actinocrinis sp.]|jgi:hypothetical protein